jgi:hypothetical protein
MAALLDEDPAVAAHAAPVVLDIEASGFGRDSYPIEVGFVLPGGEPYCSLIRPVAGWVRWDVQAQQVHGITRETVMEHGRDVREVAGELNRRLAGQTVYTDGWANDYTWLGALFEAAGAVPAFRLDNLRSLLNETQAAAWHAVKESVRQELRIERHRASADARLLQLTVMRLRLAVV